MATINDFKIIKNKSNQYADLLFKEYNKTINFDNDAEKEGFGFYLLILENITGLIDVPDLVDLICDTKFNKKLFGVHEDDCGIDAIYIDEEENSINIFNFKYRESYKPTNQQSFNEALISSKFANVLTTENIQGLAGKVKQGAESIIKRLNSNEILKFNLYVVSNEEISLSKSNSYIENLEQNYGLEIQPIGLTQITNFISIKPKPVNARLLLNAEALMTYSESSLASTVSYVFRVNIHELIRMTCNSASLREKASLEELAELEGVGFDYSILFENVRGFIAKSKFNKNITKTLEDDPSKFFFFNNGLTVIANDIDVSEVNNKKKYKVDIKGFQVLNGGQTLRSIHDFYNNANNEQRINLGDGQVLVRVFKSKDESLNNKIAEYTNSQNAISSIDLKSLRTEQIQIEQYLKVHKILYARKAGDIGQKIDDSYQHQISMERFGQILFARQGNPHKASNQKKSIFEKHYESVFVNDFKIEDSNLLVKLYFDARSKYMQLKESKNYIFSEQKVFYIMYLLCGFELELSERLIEKFEICIKDYQINLSDTLAESRVLIQVDFKEYLDTFFKLKS